LGLKNLEIKDKLNIKIIKMYRNVSPPGIILAKVNAKINNSIPAVKEK
jgi:hypothetical protein